MYLVSSSAYSAVTSLDEGFSFDLHGVLDQGGKSHAEIQQQETKAKLVKQKSLSASLKRLRSTSCE